MGSFYVNVTLLGTDLAAVRAAHAGPAYGFEEDGAVVLFAEADDDQQLTTAGPLSEALGCAALAVGVHDDDILFYEVHREGRLLSAGAVPDPSEYFDFDPELLAEAAGEPAAAMRATPDPDALVSALGQGDTGAVAAAFEADELFATHRHLALTKALGLPGGAAGWGYRYLSRDRGGWTGPDLVTF